MGVRRCPSFSPKGGFHLPPWIGQCTLPPTARVRCFGGNTAALIWVLHPRAQQGIKGPRACLLTPGDALAWIPVGRAGCGTVDVGACRPRGSDKRKWVQNTSMGSSGGN